MWSLRVAVLFFQMFCLMGSVVGRVTKDSLFNQKKHFVSLVNFFNIDTQKTTLVQTRSIKELKETDSIENLENGRVRSCNDAKQSGVYEIVLPSFAKPMKVRCETGFDKSNGNWIVIQLRQTGKENFFRSWDDYKNGFGDLETEFFYGLEKLHTITDHANMQLGIILKTTKGRKGYAIYSHFEIGDEESNYRLLEIGSMSGNIGDALNYHRGQSFSTYDRKNDGHKDENCALSYRGGWWFNKCYQSHLNGVYPYHREDCQYCARWNTFYMKQPLEYIMMAIRPRANDIFS